MRLTYLKEVYPKIVLIKAAYNYTDRCYIHLDQDTENYIVDIKEKNIEKPIDLAEFENEMLIQLARYEVVLQTKDIRKLLLARSLASTVVGDLEENKEGNSKKTEIESVLKDWFENE